MKILTQFLKFSGMMLFCGMLLLACNDPEATPEPETPDPSSSVNADTISNHLQFINATQIQGTIPKGPSGSSLKISFEDTLFLMDQVARPIKFLHKDETENVAGMYVQVHGAIGGASATYYYDVPEIPESADSDTVSVILIGVDPAGLIDPEGVPPAGAPDPFIITITPYDEGHQPIAEDVRTVKISERKIDPQGTGGTCGLVLPQGENWLWETSFTSTFKITKNNPFFFLSDPRTVFGADGQDIRGSCCEGVSVYGFCSGLDTLNASLHFATYYQISHESLVFFDDGTFFRQTFEKSPYPAPAESDFCTAVEGVVYDRINHTKYYGNWTTKLVDFPPDPEFAHYKYDPFYLFLSETSSSPVGGGFGNLGGFIHQLDCNIGALVLIQPDLEGSGLHLYKLYYRAASGIYW